MNFTSEKLEKSLIKFSVSHDAQELENAITNVYNKNKHKYSVPGFRKGHVPKKVLEGMYGATLFLDDAVNDLINSAIDQLGRGGEYNLIAFDSVSDVDFPKEGGVQYNLTMAAKPEFEVAQYKGLGVERQPVAVDDSQVDAYIHAAQHKQARLIDVDDVPAKLGDKLVLDFIGEVDGKPFEGGTAHDYELELGSHSFIETFEDQLVGAKKGDSVDVSVTFPENYEEKTLAGKPAVFHCTVKTVTQEELPALDDDFAKEISEFDTLEEYKADVRAKLVREAERGEFYRLGNAIVSKVVDDTVITIPDCLITEEQEEIVADLEHRIQHSGMTAEDYYKRTNTTREQQLESVKSVAETRVKRRLVLEAILEKEKITVDDSDIDNRIEEEAKEYGVTADVFKERFLADENTYYDLINGVLSDKLYTMLNDNNDVKKAAKKSKKATQEVGEEVAAEAPAEEKPAKKATTKKAAKPADGEAEVAEKPAKKTTTKKSTAKAEAVAEAPADEKPAKKTTTKKAAKPADGEAEVAEKPAKKTTAKKSTAKADAENPVEDKPAKKASTKKNETK